MPSKMIDALSDLAVRQAKPGTKDRKLADGRGLYLLVKSNGAKHWRLKYRLGGRERLLAIGEYPAIGLADARTARDLARRQIAEGIDPVQAKAERRIANIRAAMETFAVVAEEWVGVRAKAKGWTEQHGEQTRQSLRDFVLPHLGRRPIAAITAADVREVLDRIAKDGKMETLRRVRQRIGGVFAFAVATNRRADNPVRELRDLHAAPKREHFASIKVAELPAFLAALDAYGGHGSTKAIIRMILWTACRTGEVRGAQVGEFDLEAARWTIPAERMKKRRPHVVPLPAQAIELLHGLPAFAEGGDPSGLAFPSPGTVDQMASENVVLQALAKMGYRGRLTGHGLRALVATALEEADFSGDLVKAQLSHAKSNLTDAAYLRGIRLEQRVQMMQWWADRLAQGGAAIPATNVRPLRAA
jgi:integrase